MPYPAQVTPGRIIDAAVALIEQHGAEQMSLHQLAAALGIRTPSLYRYFANKSELFRAVNLQTAHGLTAAMRAAAQQRHSDHAARVIAIGQAYRAFAHSHPRCYLLAYSSGDPALRPDDSVLAALAEQIQSSVAPLSVRFDSLTVLRGLWAMVHGFVTLELANQIRRGGDLDAVFRAALEIYVHGLVA